MRYFITALLLSPVWLLALSIAPGVGASIHSGMEEVYSLPQVVIWALFPIISVGLALKFKEWLIHCEGITGFSLRLYYLVSQLSLLL
jgi:hypothetical protein